MVVHGVVVWIVVFLMLTIAFYGCFRFSDSHVPYVYHVVSNLVAHGVVLGIVGFLMLTMAFYSCFRYSDSRVPYVNHDVLWLFTVSLFG